MAPKKAQFSFIESLTREQRDPFKDQHFQQTLDFLRDLEQWMKEKKIKDNWTFSEKLAFLQTIESSIRTGAAVRRTQLAWTAFTLAAIATAFGLLISLLD